MPRLSRLLYISESRIDGADLFNAISQIISASKDRNANLALTGTLLFADTHFVQILEGPSGSIDQMMSSLYADRRHASIAVIIRSGIAIRNFRIGGWPITARKNLLRIKCSKSCRQRPHPNKNDLPNGLSNSRLNFPKIKLSEPTIKVV